VRVRAATLASIVGGLFAVVVGGAPAVAQNAATLVGVSGFGNFHAAGVTATIGGDANQNASLALEFRRAGASAFRAAQPLIRTSTTTFAGSLFSLSPGASWEARVTLSDPDGVTGAPTQMSTFVTRAATFAEPTVQTYFVAPGGDDGGPGTLAQPLATIQEGADRAVPGTLISIAPGIYRERAVVGASGTALQPIVFRGSAPGAILDGADAAIVQGVSWTAQGGGVYARALGFATGHVVSELGRLFRYDSLVELQALGAGAPGGFYFDGTTLRVRFSDNSSPATHTMHVARLEEGFVLDGRSFVRIENLELRHYGAGDYGKGVYLRYSSDCAVRGCRIHEIGAAGVWVKGGERNLIEGNEIWDTSIFGWPWDFTKGSSAENNGVAFSDEVGRGNVVRRNVFHGTFNGVGACGSAPPPSGITNETDLYENVLYQHTDDAFEPEGYCANVRLWRNVIEDVHMAFAVAPASPGPTWIVRNVAYDFGNSRTSQVDGYLASALKINSGYPAPVGPLVLLHNTFLTTAPGTAALTLLNPGESTWIRSRNNLFGAPVEAIYKVNPVVLDFDRDDLYRSTAGRLAWWMGSSYANLAALQAGTGLEPTGLSQAPALADAAGGDFTPTAASPLVGAAILLPGINGDGAGDPPDIGAVERSFLFDDDFEEASAARWSAVLP
jgi:parallel beta-helix repeat protein